MDVTVYFTAVTILCIVLAVADVCLTWRMRNEFNASVAKRDLLPEWMFWLSGTIRLTSAALVFSFLVIYYVFI